MQNNKECCENCQFWRNKFSWMDEKLQTVHAAECHRNPPCTNGHDTYFPKVRSDNWCGEFRWMSMDESLGKKIEKMNEISERIAG